MGKAATGLTKSFHTSQILKDLISQFQQKSNLISQAFTDENFFNLMKEDTLKSWNFTVKDESEETAQDGLGHPFWNEGFGIHSVRHPSKKYISMWAWYEVHT